MVKNENKNYAYTTHRIGRTTYKVKVVFNDAGHETLEDKILRIIQNETVRAAQLHLNFIGMSVECNFVLHDSVTSLIEIKRSSFKGFPVLLATIAISMAATFGSTL